MLPHNNQFADCEKNETLWNPPKLTPINNPLHSQNVYLKINDQPNEMLNT